MFPPPFLPEQYAQGQLANFSLCCFFKRAFQVKDVGYLQCTFTECMDPFNDDGIDALLTQTICLDKAPLQTTDPTRFAASIWRNTVLLASAIYSDHVEKAS